MFRCYFCNEITAPKTPRQSVIISKREKNYPTRRREAKGGRGGGGRFRSREGAVQDQGGKGIEIAQEVSACPTCAAKHHEAEVIALPVETVEVAETTAAAPADAAATDAAPAAEAAPAETADAKPAEPAAEEAKSTEEEAPKA